MLHIRFRFKSYPYIVADDSNIYQLSHFANGRTKPLRKLKLIKCGGSYGYIINRKFITESNFKKLAYKYSEEINTYNIIDNSLPKWCYTTQD